MNQIITTIALTGLPSDKKSRLHRQLKEKNKSKLLKQLINLIGTNLTYDQIVNLLQEHIEEKKETPNINKKIQLQDLDLLSTLVWMDIHFQKYPIWLANYIKNNGNTFYLVLANELSTIPSATKENNNKASFPVLFQERLYHYLTTFNLDYSTISGKGDALLMNAILECDFYLAQHDEFTYFMEPSSPLSQWHPSKFEVDGISFCCGEQFMMYQKAILFNDLEMAEKIMATTHPDKHQAYGRAVRGFNSKVWKQHCRDIVYKGNYAKFTQNEWLWDILHDTENSLLVEAYDQCTYWSVGLVENNPTIKDPQLWPGKNWIGYILTRVRKDIREDLQSGFETNQKVFGASEN